MNDETILKRARERLRMKESIKISDLSRVLDAMSENQFRDFLKKPIEERLEIAKRVLGKRKKK